MSATRGTRKRKLQPELKDRAEAFLNAASVSPSPKKTAPTPKPQSYKRRKVSTATKLASPKAISLPDGNDSEKKLLLPSTTAPKAKSDLAKNESSNKEPVEKRRRIMRKKAPKSYLEKLERAQTQRMIVVDRVRKETESCPIEEIDIVGTTGNIYKITISQVPSCTCPDNQKGNQCKHIVYALSTVLKAPAHLQYQLALLTSELREIFAQAPPIPTQAPTSDDTSGNRKPIEGECPICYMDFDPEHNELVWCKTACGNNMHKDCFDKWKNSSSGGGGGVRCVYCRTPWQSDATDVHAAVESARVGAEGYVNVAAEFGLSGQRDYSSYHQPWVRRTLGHPGMSWEQVRRGRHFEDDFEEETAYEEWMDMNGA